MHNTLVARRNFVTYATGTFLIGLSFTAPVGDQMMNTTPRCVAVKSLGRVAYFVFQLQALGIFTPYRDFFRVSLISL